MQRFLLAALLIPVSALRAPSHLVAASGFLVLNLPVDMFLLLPLTLLSWAAVSLAVPPPAWAE